MKWLVIILSLYVLTLSAIPCCGDDYCCEEQAVLIGCGQEHQDHDDHNKPELPCSPFFSCNTCHGVVVPDITKSVPEGVPLPRNTYYDHAAQPLPEFAASIWQPPQLC
ncbi:DUF6660 family protein [Chitinophaga nivalis]|uniref:Uncharacterized protein n=1 Tax=Chitinophaga nivalis TaxID=2991709 RepID=A0ABT3IMH5_9BACT|nr:DUF6660 family protein [Chitinophaga nivalis]MCW3465148.1 hypothetical protein [Chitinophaga nivalis]MCW3485160.1 hypothetical protein [Chitinophaga nivalis]